MLWVIARVCLLTPQYASRPLAASMCSADQMEYLSWALGRERSPTSSSQRDV